MVGKTLSHYRIVEELGRGGMGIVYKAEDSKLNRTVALKLLPPSALGSADDRARFFREAQAAAQLHHANIATVFAIEESVEVDGEQRPFIAMEYVEGETLTQHIARGPIKLDEAVQIAIQIASALEAAHEKNIVHRDVKSGNVMMTSKGVAKVLDFGLAKTSQSTKLTQLGSTLGTIAYMSPEQARGEEVDRRSDIWSLGVLIYEMISGRLPFASEYEQAAVYSILNEMPEPLTAVRTGVPMDLEWIVNKCLAKEASKRYAHVGDLLIDLKNVNVMAGGTLSTRTTTGLPIAHSVQRSSAGRKWLAPGIAGGFCLALGLVVGGLLWGSRSLPVSYSQLIVPSADFRTPSLTPDGRYLTFAGSSGTEDAAKIYTYDFQTGQTTFFEASTGVQGSTLSPDGSRLAYVSGGMLFTRLLHGADAIELVPAGIFYLTWAGNDRIVYTNPSLRQLRVIQIDGENDTEIHEIDETKGEIGIYAFGSLPDGRILVVKDRGAIGSQDLYALDVDSGEEFLVLEGDGFLGMYVSPGYLLYSPDGARLFARAFDADKLAFLGAPVSMFSITRDVPFHVGDSGRFVLLTSENYQKREIVRVDMQGNEFRVGLPDLDYEEIRVSPNGLYLAAEINRFEGRGDQVVIAPLDGSNVVQRLTFESSNFEPAWSPDGNRVIFPSERSSRTTASIYVRNADGSGNAELITPNADPNIGYPDWSSDGSLIVYSEDNWGPHGSFLGVYSIEADSVIMQLREPGTGYAYSRFSPSGRYIAYRRSFRGTQQLWVTEIASRTSRPVTSEGGNMPTWSSDESTIYFERDNSLFAVGVDASSTFRTVGVERQIYASDTAFYYDIIPDGTGFILAKSKGEADQGIVSVIDNFPEVLKTQVAHN